MAERDGLAAQTLHFFIFGSCLGMLVPLCLSFYLHYQLNTAFRLSDVLFLTHLAYFIVCLFPIIAYFIYKSRVDVSGLADTLLYITSFLAILLNVLIVQNTGGFDKSIFKFFFFYIPSAIAISYHASVSMYITGVCCFFGILFCYLDQPHSGYLGLACYTHEWVNTEENIKAITETKLFKNIYFLTMVIHLGSIISLELFKPDKKT